MIDSAKPRHGALTGAEALGVESLWARKGPSSVGGPLGVERPFGAERPFQCRRPSGIRKRLSEWKAPLGVESSSQREESSGAESPFFSWGSRETLAQHGKPNRKWEALPRLLCLGCRPRWPERDGTKRSGRSSGSDPVGPGHADWVLWPSDGLAAGEFSPDPPLGGTSSSEALADPRRSLRMRRGSGR